MSLKQISGEDFELQELLDAYDITLPSVRVFRRGIMTDYRGPLDPVGMAKYIIEDAKVCKNQKPSRQQLISY